MWLKQKAEQRRAPTDLEAEGSLVVGVGHTVHERFCNDKLWPVRQGITRFVEEGLRHHLLADELRGGSGCGSRGGRSLLNDGSRGRGWGGSNGARLGPHRICPGKGGGPALLARLGHLLDDTLHVVGGNNTNLQRALRLCPPPGGRRVGGWWVSRWGAAWASEESEEG